MDRLRAFSLNAALVAAALLIGLGCIEVLLRLLPPAGFRFRSDNDRHSSERRFPDKKRGDFSPSEKVER